MDIPNGHFGIKSFAYKKKRWKLDSFHRFLF